MNVTRPEQGDTPMLLRLILYVLAVLAPVIASALRTPAETDPLLVVIGVNLALLGLAVMAMQFVIAARIKWIEEPFGLDKIYKFHKAMAVTAVVLLAAHPVLLAAGKSYWALLTSMQQSPVVIVGKMALFGLAVLAVFSMFRAALRFEFQKWRIAHNIFAIPVVSLGFAHGLIMNSEPESVVVRGVLIVLAALAALAYLKHAVLTPLLARRRAYTVTGVRQETPNVWTIEMAPPKGQAAFHYLPGQFHFLKLYRRAGLATEEHPFTISSSPTSTGLIASTIKESGDYTATIGETKPGDEASLQGPFGRFSYALYPNERDLVFISGGIGITPLISMLRHMRDTEADISVQLLCFNRTQSDIAFRDELALMESGEHPLCRVTHILSEPDESWQGDRGLPNREMLGRIIGGNLGAKSYYVCGPAAMMKIVIRGLLDLGVPRSRIRSEEFVL